MTHFPARYRGIPRLGLVTLLTCLSFIGCRTDPKEITQGSDSTQIQVVTEPISDLQTSGNDSIGDPMPVLIGELVFAQAFDTVSRRALLTGLPGAVVAGATEICAQNLTDPLQGIDCFSIQSSDGSFRGTLDNAAPDDVVAMWGNGPTYAAGGVGINEINEKVQYWSQRFPGARNMLYSPDPTGLNIRDLQGVDDGLFIGDYDGLYFIGNSDLSLDPEAIFPEKFTIANGLPSNQISSLSRDRENLWIGTGNGIARMSLVTREIEETYLPGLTIQYLVSDGDKGVWVSGSFGLLHLALDINGTTLDTYHHDPADPQSLPNDDLTCLTSDSAGGLWVGTYQGLAYAPSGGSPVRFQAFTTADGLPSNAIVSCAAATGEEGIWVGGDGFASRVVPENGSIRIVTIALSYQYIQAMASADDGTVWAGTAYDGSTRRFSYIHLKSSGAGITSAPYSVTSNTWMDSVETLWPAPNGDLFVATGVVLRRMTFDATSYDPAITEFVSEKSLPSNDIQNIFSESPNGIWIVTENSFTASSMDLSKKPEEITQFDIGESLGPSGSHYLALMAPSINGRTWALYRSVSNTSAGYLYEFERENQSVRLIHSLNWMDGVPDDIRQMLEDGEGGLWLSTTSDGLYRLTLLNGNPHFSQVASSASLARELATSIDHDDQGGVWVGTTDGLTHVRADGGAFTPTFFDSRNSALPNEHVIDVASDGNGGAWIVTNITGYTSVLSHLDGLTGQFSDPTLWDGLLQDSPSKLLSDGKGGVWVGTVFNGLTHLRAVGNSFDASHFGAAEGLPDLRITALDHFPLGGLIVGTSNGFVIAPYW